MKGLLELSCGDSLCEILIVETCSVVYPVAIVRSLAYISLGAILEDVLVLQ